jgi:hypothetical protein
MQSTVGEAARTPSDIALDSAAEVLIIELGGRINLLLIDNRHHHHIEL